MSFVPSLKLAGIATAGALAVGGLSGWKLGAGHWQSQYQDIRVEFADYKAARATDQLTSFTKELKAQREAEEAREAAYQAKIAAANARVTSFQKRLSEVSNANPSFKQCLDMPVPDGLREQPAHPAPGTVAGTGSIF